MTYMWNLKKNDTNELICRTDSQTWKTNLTVTTADSQGGHGLRVWHRHTVVYGMTGQEGPAI